MSDVEKAQISQAQYAQREAARRTPIADPAALGLFGFAATTFMLSMYNTNVRNITTPNVVVGMACFMGGLSQFMAGMWEFPRGNTFGAAAFTSYGAFWMSYATILIPGSGIISAYGANLDELGQALAIYLLTWWMVTTFFLVASLRSNIAMISLFVFLDLTFILLTAAAFTGHAAVNKAGGVFGIITAFIAFYIGLSAMCAPGTNWFTLPVGSLKRE